MAVVDTDDMGEAAAIVLTRPGYTGAAFELCGPAPLSTAEMAAIIAAELGRPIRAEARSLDDWAAHAKGQGWTPWAIDAYSRMCRHYDEFGFPGGNPLVLRAILGREPGDFRAFARRFVAEMKGGGA
jgi:nucleoside-diphosphate-sugar epimerase